MASSMRGSLVLLARGLGRYFWRLHPGHPAHPARPAHATARNRTQRTSERGEGVAWTPASWYAEWMRSLLSPPRTLVDPETRTPRFGAYRGDLPPVDLASLGKRPLFSFLHRKRWVFVTITEGELFFVLAIVHLGYAVSSFFFAFDRAAGRMLIDRSHLGPPFLGAINDAAGEGCSASFHDPLQRTSLRVERPLGAAAYRVELRAPDMELDALLGTAGAPPAVGAIVPLDGPSEGLVHATQKHALLSVTGHARIAGQRRALDGGLAGIDYSQGFVPRRTAWKWAFALGHARTGERVGLNLVEGFVGAPECAIWIDGELHPLAEGRFAFDAARPLEPWSIQTADGSADLRFVPGALHAERRSLGLVSSSYILPVGSLSGAVRVEGRGSLELERVLGVVEDQQVLW